MGGEQIPDKHSLLKPVPEEPVRIPIDGTLDLHTFNPKELPELLEAYLTECHAHHLHTVKIIHGKGSGVLRARVISLLKRSKLVKGYHTGNETNGSWGVTLVEL